MATKLSAAILLSRQNLRPSLRDVWVRKLGDAVQFVKENNLRLTTSIGSPNWDIITAFASIAKVKMKVVVPIVGDKGDNEHIAQLKYEFSLSDEDLEFDSFRFEIGKKLTGRRLRLRDQLVFDNANVLIPISIKPDGNMSNLLAQAESSEKEIIRDFETDYSTYTQKLSYTINSNLLSNEIKQLENNYIIHWTRAANRSWPDETKLEYYNDILNSPEYPRTALETLKRIIKSKKLIGTSKNIPNGTNVVSFSGLRPADTIKLMLWRSRFRQMSFEPYGIGLEREAALETGVKPVIYYDSEKDSPINAESWYTQSIGRKADWRNEQEFRFKGNFDLSKIANEKLIVITHYKNEAKELESVSGLRTSWFIN